MKPACVPLAVFAAGIARSSNKTQAGGKDRKRYKL